ncbi:unnamed protein product [Penicillium olsonii]|uniref:N-acetyltransferase domain-containing protein n=1 Tax=Penicillium olsonii TaxID=99116 RepID=A0A9W4MK04_PENOL|nr:unnamed protein product [Penicillium olsonii]CAG7978017.1 unnamed protein product [Penicillium olsonii]
MSPQLRLIPWDAESQAHREWLVKQRIECGWHKEKVEVTWRSQQLKGQKCIFWIQKLEDTALTLNAAPRQPTQETFIPIGHVSLDSYNPEIECLDLEIPAEGVFWIKTFYISRSIQGQGIGRATMDYVESMAVRKPLLAKTLMLDTVQKDDQMQEDFAIATFGSVPKSTNQEWYARRGYRLIKTIQNFYRHADKNGRVWDIRTVFMRKDIEA